MTDKQVEYIINRVLIPRIEFHMQHSYMTWIGCNNLTKCIRKLVRNKTSITNTLPNSIIHHKGFYNIHKIWNIVKENQIANLIARLNNPGPAGLSTWIRIKQAQILNWEPKNILRETIPKGFNTKNNLSCAILKLANSMDITIQSAQWEDKYD